MCCSGSRASRRATSAQNRASKSASGTVCKLNRVPSLSREVRVGERLDDRVKVAVDHLVEVVRLVADAVIRYAVLWEVVGSDPLGAVDGADLAAPLRRRARVRLLPGVSQQPGTQNAQRLFLVLELALLVLAGD